MLNSTTKRIASIIGNDLFATAINNSIEFAVRSKFVHLFGERKVRKIFDRSLEAAIRDIETHERGKLFRRLIEYGPHNPDEPESLESDGDAVLSDPECGECVEFIFSHMVNRFKGELAELLALEPCIALLNRLRREHRIPNDMQLYWGDTIKERRHSITKDHVERWKGFTKGADGLIVTFENKPKSAVIHGIVEIKSMYRSRKTIVKQMRSHLERLSGGLQLDNVEWRPEEITIGGAQGKKKYSSGILNIMVIPSSWKLSREWKSAPTERGRELVFPTHVLPPVTTTTEEIESNLWKITLSWSKEVIEQAAYEMTFWYMSQVGEYIYSRKELPKGWEYMSAKEAGYNAIKMMLYFLPLRYITKRQERLATKLYNVYSFSYPLGIDSKEMLWPEDFSGAS